MKRYTYKRKDGGTTDCYGNLRLDSNLEIACENEIWDEIIQFTDGKARTWEQVCQYAEQYVNDKIEQITAC